MNNASHPAAQFCKAVNVGGYTDWYMPAKNELEVCYYNLKANTQVNNTSSGINSNAVPARASNYTSGTPAQTAASLFITVTGAEAFSLVPYWSSTERPNSNAFYQRFTNGYQGYGNKQNPLTVRAIRRVAA